MRLTRTGQTVALAFALSLTSTLSTSAREIQQQPAEATWSKEQQVQAIIDKAENLYKLAEEELARGSVDRARKDFDRAVDLLLEAPAELRADPKSQGYYRSLVDRINAMQLSAVQDGGVGYTEQKYVPSAIDQLSALSAEDLEVAPKNRVAVNPEDFDFKFEITPVVQQYLTYFTEGRGRATMEAGLRRSGRYRPMAERIFREEGVPLDLIWLAQAESSWKANALSFMSAKGIWQFMPYTGLSYGLEQNEWVDQRSDPELATRAAAKYLRYLYDYFGGNWILAMAAYNTGPNNVDKAVQRTGYDDFWEFYRRGFLPQETRNYVPIILASIVVAKDPKRFGFDITPDPEWTYEMADVPSQTDLRVVANLLNTPLDLLQDYNPEFRRSVTPPGRSSLRIPKGMKEQFEIAYSVLPEDQRMRRDIIIPYEERVRGSMRVRYASYRVRTGDTLGRLAGRFGISQKELARANHLNASARLSPGQNLRVPRRIPGTSYKVRYAKSKRYSATRHSVHHKGKTARNSQASRRR